MRKSDLGKSQYGSTPDTFQRRRRDEWRQAQVRAVRFPQPNARRGILRRGAR